MDSSFHLSYSHNLLFSTSRLIKISDLLFFYWLILSFTCITLKSCRWYHLQIAFRRTSFALIIKCTGHNRNTDEELSSFLWPGPSLMLFFPLLGYQRGCWRNELHTFRSNLEIHLAQKVCSGKMKHMCFCQGDISLPVSEGWMEPNYKSELKNESNQRNITVGTGYNNIWN